MFIQSLGIKDSLDKALDLFLQLKAQEEAFWKEYRHRVNVSLQAKLHDKGPSLIKGEKPAILEQSISSKMEDYSLAEEELAVDDLHSFEEALEDELVLSSIVFQTSVPSAYADLLHKNLYYFSEFFKWHIETTGKPPEPPALNLSATTPISENGFRKDGEIWEISFQGKSISLKDTKGMRYIAFLIGHPRKEYNVLNLVSEVDGSPAEFVKRHCEKRTVEESKDEKSAGNHDHSLPSDESVDVILDAQAQEEIKTLQEISLSNVDGQSNYSNPFSCQR